MIWLPTTVRLTPSTVRRTPFHEARVNLTPRARTPYILKRHIGPRVDADGPRMVHTGGSGTKLPGRIPSMTESTACPQAPEGTSPILAGRSSPGILAVRGFSVGL